VTSTCQSNGTWYELACGPRGAELLPHRQWLEGQHTAGYERFDARIVDSFASVVQKRGEEVGASELLAPALAAAEAWFRQNDDGSDVSAFEAETEQRRKVAVWTQAMCLARVSNRLLASSGAADALARAGAASCATATSASTSTRDPASACTPTATLAPSARTTSTKVRSTRPHASTWIRTLIASTRTRSVQALQAHRLRRRRPLGARRRL
jgi:hypothetical protein